MQSVWAQKILWNILKDFTSSIILHPVCINSQSKDIFQCGIASSKMHQVHVCWRAGGWMAESANLQMEWWCHRTMPELTRLVKMPLCAAVVQLCLLLHLVSITAHSRTFTDCTDRSFKSSSCLSIPTQLFKGGARDSFHKYNWLYFKGGSSLCLSYNKRLWMISYID